MTTVLRPSLIAEVKTRSPFGWQSSRSWGELFAMANRHGEIISVHTDPAWGGSLEHIAKARRLSDKPILAKGVHTTDSHVEQALNAGADMVLVVGRVPASYLGSCLLEPLALDEMKDYPADSRVVWNSRDLANGGLKTQTFEDARSHWPGWLCQASNIRNLEDVHEGADAILVGSYLPEFIASLG